MIPNIFSDNLTATLSDYYSQFLIAPNVFFNSSTPRSNKYERIWTRFDKVNFVLDYFLNDCNNLLLVSNIIVDNLYKSFVEKV